MRRVDRLALLTLLALLPVRASAQAAWETPMLASTQAIGGVGLFFVRFATFPQDGEGAFLTWSSSAMPAGVTLRVGAAEGAGGTTAGFGGADVTAPLATRTDSRPVDLSWNAGAGLAVGRYLLVSVPVGISAGRAWEEGPVWLSPYLTARLSMDLRLGEDAPPDEFNVNPSVDLGLDAAFDRARRAVLRFSTSFGDRSGWALGVVLGN